MRALWLSQERFRLPAIAGLALAALGVAAGVYVITTTSPTANSIYPKCPTHQLTGIHCPGCGTGRAAHFLLTGRPLDAVRYNLFAPVLLPFFVIMLFRSLVGWARQVPLADWPRVRARWLRLLLAVLIIYTVVRNIPWSPLDRLAPTEVVPAAFDPIP